MKKLLVLIPILIALLACNFAVSKIPVTPTEISASDPSPIPHQATFTFTPEPNSTQLIGTVTGQLSYPSEFLPPTRVVLFSLSDKKAYFVDTAKGQAQFSLNVPAGAYYLVSYPYEGTAGNTGQVDSYTLAGGSYAGGYTQMVPCGLAAGCNDHTLLPITVTESQTINADPGDWYAPEGTFPPLPNP